VGIGAWEPISFLTATINDSRVDDVDVHVYPNPADASQQIQELIQIGQIAGQHNKPIIIDEFWLHYSSPTGETILQQGANSSKAGVFAFWEPLDQEFLQDMTKFSQVYGVVYASPFAWENFFAYLNYSSSYQNLSSTQLQAMEDRAAGQNIASNLVTSTGCFYKNLIGGH
jgi:hypothetical protein